MGLRFWGVPFGSGYGAETEDVGINTEVEAVTSHISHPWGCMERARYE